MFENIPKNWEKVALENLLEYEQPTNYIVASEEYNDSYPIPVLTAGKSFILGYTNETEGIYQNTPVIIFDDFTTESKFVDFEFKVKSSAMKILKAKDNDTLKYLYYLMQILPFNNTQHKRYWISEYSKIKIGIPKDINEVKEIVKVLDAASEIIRLRTACIESARSLIPALFQEMFGDPINNKKNLAKEKIGKILTLTSGKFIPSKELNTNGQYPVYGGNGINGYHNEFLFEDSKICIGRVGVKCGCVHKTKPNSWITDNALYINNYLIPINETYLKEALTQINLNQYAKRAAQPVISQTTIYNQYILLPRIEQQELFAAKVQEIEAYIKAQEVELENAKTMFQSLLHHSFTGELTRHKFGGDANG